MTKEDLLVIKNDKNIIIAYFGTKLVKPIDGFEKMSIDEIKQWFIDEFNKERGEIKIWKT